ncbi:MAG TPA: hypothetical protein VHZ51_07380 [Ktedonobacteraceae bacterium]|nr:hypothetical protein [Ktedonobacteraceae bacterium]
MPVTRRKRANPPEQPENNNHVAEQAENQVEANSTEQLVSPDQPQVEDSAERKHPTPPATPDPSDANSSEEVFYQQLLPPNGTNGDQPFPRGYNQTIQSGRRTARGELFHRPPQVPGAPVPDQPAAPATPQPSLQPPSHEMKLPLGVKPGDTTGDPLHFAYNPGYTGADEARSALLRKLAAETKHGGRARCWGCGALAIAYECWNTRSKSFGEIGVAYCEICGVWSVM